MFTKVLVVEDDEAVLRGYRVGFARHHELFTAQSADEALRLAANNPDLIIVDLRIGRDWGIPLIRRLRVRLPEAKIVLVSGFVSVASAIAALRAGADHAIPKPTTASAILRELEEGENEVQPEVVEAAEEMSDDMPSLARVEWEHIVRALTECEGNVSRAARRLGIRRTSLQRKLKKRPPPS